MYPSDEILEALLIQDLISVRRMLECNVREEAARKSGNINQLKAVKALLKMAPVNKPVLQKAQPLQYRGENWYVFINNSMLLASPSAFGYEVASEEEKIHTEYHLKPYQFSTPGMTYEIEPDAVKVAIVEDKAARKAAKKKETIRPFRFSIGGMSTGVDPHYLKNAMDFTGGQIIYCDPKKHGKFDCNMAPLYIPGKDCIAVIMPILL